MNKVNNEMRMTENEIDAIVDEMGSERENGGVKEFPLIKWFLVISIQPIQPRSMNALICHRYYFDCCDCVAVPCVMIPALHYQDSIN